MMIVHHSLGFQVFNHNHIICLYKPCTQLIQIVFFLIGNMFVYLCTHLPCFLVVPEISQPQILILFHCLFNPQNPSWSKSLPITKTFFGFLVKARHVDLRVIRKNCKIFEPDTNADWFACLWKINFFIFAKNRCFLFSWCFLSDGNGTDSSMREFSSFKVYGTRLWNADVMIVDDNNVIVDAFGNVTLLMFLWLELWKTGLSLKETGICIMQISRCSSQGGWIRIF